MKGNALAALVPSVVKRQYRVKFVVSFLFVLLVIGSVGVAGYVQVDRATETASEESLASTAELQADALSEWVKSMKTQTRTTAQSDELRADDPNGSRAYLGTHRRSLTLDVANVHYFDAESGEILATVDDSLENRTLEEIDEPWASADVADELANDRDVWVSDSSYEQFGAKRVMAFATRVPGAPNEILVLVGTLDIRVDNLHQSGPNQTTAIVSTDGAPVLTPLDETGSWDDRRVEAATANGTVVSQEDGHVRAYAPVSGTDWVAVTSVPTADAFAVRDAVGMTVAVVVGTGFLSLALVGVVLGRQTVLPLTRLRREAERMEAGDLDVDLETNRVDEIGKLFAAFDSMRNSLRRRIQEVEEARDEADRTNRHLEAKAADYSEVMRECADGDFTRRMDPESENDAMEEIATEFNEMIADIEETTERLTEFAAEVATASEQVTASTEEVRAASTQVTDSIQAISGGADRQNESLQAVDHEMSGLSSTVEEIASSSNTVADVAERTASAGEAGREAATAAIEGMDEIETESERAVEEIEALAAEIEQIDELVEFITEVAEQTNMLALNANIEAARSTTGGDDGFGVVAGEVKDLAAETKEAAADIEALIEDIKSQTDRTAEEVQRTSRRVADHREAIEHAATSLERIATYARETNDGVQDISAATEQQAAATEEIVAMVDEVATISEETSSEAENVAAAAEEQTSSLTEVTRSVAHLSEQAAQLSDRLDQFETDAGNRLDRSGSPSESDDADDDVFTYVDTVAPVEEAEESTDENEPSADDVATNGGE